jgi:hypothetical protein
MTTTVGRHTHHMIIPAGDNMMEDIHNTTPLFVIGWSVAMVMDNRHDRLVMSGGK